MKKIFTSFFAAMLAVAASAQVTATISPSTKNVFTPSEYEYVSVTYGDTLTLSSASATVAYGSDSTTVPVDSTTTLQALFDIDAAITSLGVPDGGVFTVTVSGVSGADDASASYKYYATLPEPTASVSAGSTLSSKTSSVIFSFNQSVQCPYIEYTSGSVVNTDSLGTDFVTSVTANIQESYWSSSAADITVSLVGVTDASGYVYPPYDATYYYAETVNYLGVDISPDTCTYQRLYDEFWCINFKYDKEIVAPEGDVYAIVIFKDADKSELASVELSEYDVSVNYRPEWGCYAVEVYVPEVPEDASDYEYAEIALQGFSYGGSLIDDQSITFKSSTSSAAKTRSGSLTGISASLVSKGNKTVDVYNIQGMLVKNNTSDLKGLTKGIYVVDGKKIVIK